jgi:hypothetical protein
VARLRRPGGAFGQLEYPTPPLEPFKALDVDQMIALMDADDRAALEQLVDLLAAQEPRVLTGVAG